MAAGDEDALRDLSYRYASALDRRDMAGYLAVFEPEGLFEMYGADDPDQPTLRTEGHRELVYNLNEVDLRFRRTMHFVGNAHVEVNGDRATGEVYCIAHHLPAGGENHDYVMHIRYDDEYARGADGAWRIRRRRLTNLWTATLPVDGR